MKDPNRANATNGKPNIITIGIHAVASHSLTVDVEAPEIDSIPFLNANPFVLAMKSQSKRLPITKVFPRSCRPLCFGSPNHFLFHAISKHTLIMKITINKKSKKKLAICRLQPEVGLCNDNEVENYHKRWFYDESRGSCMSFIYSGCMGNQNNFRSFESCVQFCSKFWINERALSKRLVADIYCTAFCIYTFRSKLTNIFKIMPF